MIRRFAESSDEAALGKKVFVATWGNASLAARMHQAAFDHFDLAGVLDRFGSPPPSPSAAEGAARTACLDELERTEQNIASGYAGVSLFIMRWRSDALDPNPQIRQRLLDQLTAARSFEICDAPDGAKAMRCVT